MASIAAQSAGEIETIISQKASQVQAQANNLGKLRWRGFTSEIQNIVGDLPKVPILSWVRANSGQALAKRRRSEEHTYELQSLMRTAYAVYVLKQNITTIKRITHYNTFK